MVEDLVVGSYKEQIRESLLKAKAIDIAGFSVMIEELKKRGINTDRVVNFFSKIKASTYKADLDRLTVDELDEVIDDINMQVTRALISPIEISDTLIRSSRIIAREMSINSVVTDDDKFVKVGVNLASEVTKHGIAKGLNTCIKNYCIQRLYQFTYKEKIEERVGKTGIKEEKTEEKKIENNIPVREKSNVGKNKTMNEIFQRDIENENKSSFDVVKNNYLEYLAKVVSDIKKYE